MLAPPSRHVIKCIIFRRMGEVAICSMNKQINKLSDKQAHTLNLNPCVNLTHDAA